MNSENDKTPITPDPQQSTGIPSTGSPAPKKNKVLLWISIIITILIIIIGIALFMNRANDKKDDSGNKTADTSSNSKKESDSNDVATNSKFEKYEVQDPIANYSVSFYKGATTLDKNSLHYLIAGDEGSQTSAYISLGTSGELDCQGTPSTTMNVAGQSIKVCYQQDNKIYSGQLAVKGVATRVNVAGQKSVSMEDAKTILESFSFK